MTTAKDSEFFIQRRDPAGTGAVITDPAGRVLLEVCSPGCSSSSGFWSLPGGRVANSETAEFTASGERPEASSDRRFFAASEIPEEISIDGCLGVLASLSSQRNALQISDVTDRIFSALFYSHLWPILTKTWPSEGASSSLRWTIRNIPFRKFKSAIPFLLTASHPRSIVPALAAELMFALFYLLDDLIDERTHRYGRETAFGAGGPAHNATAIMVGLTQIDEWLVSMQASSNLRRIVSTGARVMADEQNRRRGTGANSMEEYTEHSMRRTRFLGDLWAVACQESGCEAEASLVRHVYDRCALAGQIKNDLRDIRSTDADEHFRDIRDGVRNSCILRLLQVADAGERKWMTRCLADTGTLTKDAEAELVQLFSRHRVEAWASDEVRSLSQQILNSVNEADIVDAKKCVLSEWVGLQFTSGLVPDCEDSPARVSRLVTAVSELTDRL